ncbi:hypothetical protein CNY89_20635, partial [Amaricoccus sp. HAR-UPW-R2A-40]
PNEDSIVRLIGAVLLEQNDEWQLQHRYMQIEGMVELDASAEASPSLICRSRRRMTDGHSSTPRILHQLDGRDPCMPVAHERRAIGHRIPTPPSEIACSSQAILASLRDLASDKS